MAAPEIANPTQACDGITIVISSILLKAIEIMVFNGQRQFSGPGSTIIVVSAAKSEWTPLSSLERETDTMGQCPVSPVIYGNGGIDSILGMSFAL